MMKFMMITKIIKLREWDKIKDEEGDDTEVNDKEGYESTETKSSTSE